VYPHHTVRITISFQLKKHAIGPRRPRHTSSHRANTLTHSCNARASNAASHRHVPFLLALPHGHALNNLPSTRSSTPPAQTFVLQPQGVVPCGTPLHLGTPHTHSHTQGFMPTTVTLALGVLCCNDGSGGGECRGVIGWPRPANSTGLGPHASTAPHRWLRIPNHLHPQDALSTAAVHTHTYHALRTHQSERNGTAWDGRSRHPRASPTALYFFHTTCPRHGWL